MSTSVFCPMCGGHMEEGFPVARCWKCGYPDRPSADSGEVVNKLVVGINMEPTEEMVEAAKQYIDALRELVIGYRHNAIHQRMDMLHDVVKITEERWCAALSARKEGS